LSCIRALYSRIGIAACLLSLVFSAVSLAQVQYPPRYATALPKEDLVTKAGILGVTITNIGYIGNSFRDRSLPSCEYPLNSNVEHLFSAGVWVGALSADGDILVTTGSQDAPNLEAGAEQHEFVPTEWDSLTDLNVYIGSNSQNSENYDIDALATQHLGVHFHDFGSPESGTHTPLGLDVRLRVFAWGNPYADDFVILDYTITNVSGRDLREVYVGFWNDTTVGNTEVTDPYDPQAPVDWDFYDDLNGAWGSVGWVDPEYTVANDPDIWMSYEHDDDGEEGMATSWIGTRLLGTVPAVADLDSISPVSYNSWTFPNVPDSDDEDVDTGSPGKYQLMSNGDFDVGSSFDNPSNWIALMSTGPFPFFASGDTIRATFALVAGPDSLGLLANSKVAQLAYDAGFTIPGGPPSPLLDVAFDNNTVILKWAPGDTIHPETGAPLPSDDPLRSPEHHISTITTKPDFQGYRVYRFQGETIPEDPYSISTLVAEFDKVDGSGFDTGLPPLDSEGRRVFRDSGLLDGFPYWYSVVSFSAPDPLEGLPSFSSGFNENALLLFPGPEPADTEHPNTIGVYPNPYRAGSLFDSQHGAQELGRKIWFTGLPARCRILVYNLAGDLVKTLHHNDTALGMEPWDILSEPQRAIATGLYIYVVQDEDTGDVQRGKLVIIK